MPDLRKELESAFLEDHRHLTQGLDRVARALAEDDLPAAVTAAGEVDERVGPHMRFEEEELYPRLRHLLGDEFVDRLYDEHGEGREAIRRLLEAKRRGGVAPSEREEIAALIRTALDHALSCGTLLSHLESFEESEQRLLLARLYALRAQGARWTEQTDDAG